MLITYDVEAKRTQKFKKLLCKYLIHTQYSVFAGDITEGKAIELRRELNRLIKVGDRVTEITAKNRHNIEVIHLIKNTTDKGDAKRQECNKHNKDFIVL
jgi:CRISPR-associated protein Cas2